MKKAAFSGFSADPDVTSQQIDIAKMCLLSMNYVTTCVFVFNSANQLAALFRNLEEYPLFVGTLQIRLDEAWNDEPADGNLLAQILAIAFDSTLDLSQLSTLAFRVQSIENCPTLIRAIIEVRARNPDLT